jgi:F-type H+/Na+-transporting ATPase subunit alpha
MKIKKKNKAFKFQGPLFKANWILSSFTKNTLFGIIKSLIDGIALISSIPGVLMGEILQVGGLDINAIVINIEEEGIKAVILKGEDIVKPGFKIARTKELFKFPVTSQLLGRVVNAYGEPIDYIEKFKYAFSTQKVEIKAPGIISRYKVNEPLQTGVKAVDSLIPIGRGQRELIIGDKSTGKTTIGVDTILNQKNNNWVPATHVHCIYVSIGQRRANVAKLSHLLRKKDSMSYSVILAATASESCALQFLVPYCATALGEYLMTRGAACLIIYDDLSKHAVAYRQLSLLLRRFPSREAYPADVFYLHSRLLERSTKYNDDNNFGGSLTSLPVIETQLGDVSAYIPTNVISITDGQIFLESQLFNKGIRPAVNTGLSVSRIGSAAQNKIMKTISGPLKLELAQYREMQSLEQFGENLEEATKKLLMRGKILTELLIQPQSKPVVLENEIVMLYAGVNNLLRNINLKLIPVFEKKLVEVKNTSVLYQAILNSIHLKFYSSISLDLLVFKLLLSI